MVSRPLQFLWLPQPGTDCGVCENPPFFLTPNPLRRCRYGVMTSQSCSVEVERLISEAGFVRSIARSLLFDGHEVDDLVQQTWLRALEKPPKSIANSRGYLGGLTRSLISNHRRSSARRKQREAQGSKVEGLPSPAELLAHQEMRSAVARAVSELPESYRTVVLLRYYEGLPPRRIATELGLGRDAVATRLKRGLKRLRETLDSECGGRRSWCLALIPLARPNPTMTAALAAKAAAIAGVMTTMKGILAGLGILVVFLIARSMGEGEQPLEIPLGEPSSTEFSGAIAVKEDGEGAIALKPFVAPAPDATKAQDVEAAVRAALGGFRGRLVSEDHKAIAGAVVKIFSLDPTTSFGGTADLLGRGEAGIGGGETRSDAEGKFLIRGIWPGSVHAIYAGVGGKSPTFRVLSQSPGTREVVDLGDVELVAGASLKGIVLGPDRKPLVGAKLWAIDLPSLVFAAAPLERLDEDSALLLSLPKVPVAELASGELYHARLPSHLVRTMIKAEDDSEFVTLELPKWARRVLRELPRCQAISGPDGRFLIHGLPEGKVTILARHPELATARRSAEAQVGKTVDVGRIRLRAGRAFRGQIVDAEGLPVPEATVRVAIRPPNSGVSGLLFAGPARLTDAEGRFRVRGLPRGRVQLSVRRRVGDPWITAGPFSSRGDVLVKLAATIDQELKLLPAKGQRLESVRVFVQQGPPMGEITLSGLAPQLSLEGRFEEEPQDDGSVLLRFRGLMPGLYTVFVRSAGHAPGCCILAVGKSAPKNPVLQLEPARAVALVVKDGEGHPVVGARIYLQRGTKRGSGDSPEERPATKKPDWARSVLFRYGGMSGWKSLARKLGATDARGCLTIPDLPLGATTLIARHPGYGLHRLELVGGEEELVMTLPMPGALSGRLFDHGVPASSRKWRISLNPCKRNGGPGVKHFAALDEDGHFSLQSIAAGEYELQCVPALDDHLSLGSVFTEVSGGSWGSLWGGRSSYDILIRSGQTTKLAIDVDRKRLAPGSFGSTLRGSLTVDGKAATGWSFHAGKKWHPLNDEGRFEEGGLKPGRLSLLFRPSAKLSAFSRVFSIRKEFIVGSDGEFTVDLSFQSASIDGLVLKTNSEAADDQGVTVEGLTSKGWIFRSFARSDARGHFSVRVPAGRGSISVSGPAGMAEQPYEAESGEVVPIELSISVEGMISGVVEWGDGVEPVTNMVFTATDGMNFSYYATVDSKGSYFSGQIAPGIYKVSAVRGWKTFKVTPEIVTIPKAGLRGQRFVLR